ncbi:glutaminase GtaA [Aspergillus clavatus NRRL 1]|uniref:Glutaminase GtaA n=1 Tax=Aspergillus clavatus (strain ATCC 1007 / CBS 513.65 / DSM 816 / NCTC 3887 / NRRL 1 / QM 1276 / 107) TaxID=344612 RepID=A1CJH2_ASPCL|nr:glutaminase GtaA [Aspergillus clavatus NRRL 1]EAW09296.1 glutaminase GtaA [Aspergillus clavatus NRRL 1]
MQLFPLGVLAASLASLAGAVSTFSPARPPALPLAVKSPYLSTWLSAGRDGGNGGYLAGEWPTFWEGQVNGWAGLIRVDGSVYTWMGLPGTTTANQTKYEYTSTKSIFTFNVGDAVEMKVTFLSPITPNDLRRQSLVFSYLHVEISSIDGDSHDVQLYSDIAAEWASGDRAAVAEWDYGVTNDGIAYHKVHRQNQLLFSEAKEQAEWGNWYWATEDNDNLTYQSGPDVDVRGAFSANGVLSNSQDANYRTISKNWPVFGFAVDLGDVGSSPVDTLFTIGLAQTEAIQYSSPKGTQAVPSLWTSYFDDDLAALNFFHYDYSEANEISSALDQKIASDSIRAAGQDYLTITSLSARQAFAATQLAGTSENPYLFMKEISSNGNMNTVDVIFPAHPVFLYTNPELLRLLMKPHFELQESGQYPNAYAMHDIGTHYPNATGHPQGNDEPMPLEECGNMVIMALAYALKSKNKKYLSDHYSMLEQWATYLVDDAIYPANQISTDDFAGPLANQTNLALKGMIGIEAMAAISNLTGHADAAANRSAIARDYINRWQYLGVAHDANPPHTTLSYGSNESHGLLYNLFADRELGLNLVPQSVYDMQSEFYPTVKQKYGVPLDTRHQYTKGDWELFAAAVASPSTRDMFIQLLAKWINETPTNRALTDLYDTVSGDYPGNVFIARPVMGGAFALLLLAEGL